MIKRATSLLLGRQEIAVKFEVAEFNSLLELLEYIL
jgi:hypothetical protein